MILVRTAIRVASALRVQGSLMRPTPTAQRQPVIAQVVPQNKQSSTEAGAACQPAVQLQPPRAGKHAEVACADGVLALSRGHSL
jgi:hypothetical protein